MTVLGVDGRRRCFGGQAGKELYAQYHDHEWGRPHHADRHLFEMLVLEGAQAGLSWETVLKKRAAYREAFHQFDPAQVATMSDAALEEVLLNPGLIRNRLKIFSARKNAQAFLKIQEEYGSFDAYLWAFVGSVPQRNCVPSLAELPVETAESRALSKDLKKRGMTFVGPTIMYAYMQAVGLVNDHVAGCFLSIDPA